MAPAKGVLAAALGSVVAPWVSLAHAADTCGPYGCAADEATLAASEEANGTSVSLLQRRLGQEAKDRRAPCEPQAPWPRTPKTATEHNGISWPELCYSGSDEKHVMLMGDYGGITCGDHETTGHKDPNAWACKHANKGVYSQTVANIAPDNDRGRKLYHGVDDRAQTLVAEAMRKRAKEVTFDYALNGGDNFYFGGLDTLCGHPMDQLHERTRVQFDAVFENMYNKVDLNIPFLSVLGNHDYGGMKFNAAWDQQIAYTFAQEGTTKRWIMPAPYWHQHVRYPDADFSVDYFMLDTNTGDAKPHEEDEGHNICGLHNTPHAGCGKNGGPRDVGACLGWFRKLWADQKTWLEKHLTDTKADWQVIVTHMPPDAFMGRDYWKHMTVRFGLDLFVGSHRHYQQIYPNDKRYNGLNYVVCGGGGGITSEYNPDNSKFGRGQYGFMDLAITKTKMKVSAIDERGQLNQEMSFGPRPPLCANFDGTSCQESASCASSDCQFKKGNYCQCAPSCVKYRNCCSDYEAFCKDVPQALP